MSLCPKIDDSMKFELSSDTAMGVRGDCWAETERMRSRRIGNWLNILRPIQNTKNEM